MNDLGPLLHDRDHSRSTSGYCAGAGVSRISRASAASSSRTRTLKPAPDQATWVTHTADRIGLNHGFDARAFESALGKIRLGLASKGVDDHKVSFWHALILRPDGQATKNDGLSYQ